MRALVAMVGICFCANVRGTTIVAIWTPSRIVISGDSLLSMNWTGENGEPRHKTSKDCKIRKYGANYISAAGNYRIQTAGFDLWQTAQHACGSSASVDSCAANLKAELRRVLTRVAGIHDVHLSVIVAGKQDGNPALDHITFIGTPDGRLSVRSESYRKGRQKWGRVILGERDAIDRYERNHESTMSESMEDQAMTLVKIEARALPQEVGAPISTLIIEANAERWMSPGCCPASCSK